MMMKIGGFDDADVELAWLSYILDRCQQQSVKPVQPSMMGGQYQQRLTMSTDELNYIQQEAYPYRSYGYRSRSLETCLNTADERCADPKKRLKLKKKSSHSLLFSLLPRSSTLIAMSL
jgi:hypothetical protein